MDTLRRHVGGNQKPTLSRLSCIIASECILQVRLIWLFISLYHCKKQMDDDGMLYRSLMTWSCRAHKRCSSRSTMEEEKKGACRRIADEYKRGKGATRQKASIHVQKCKGHLGKNGTKSLLCLSFLSLSTAPSSRRLRRRRRTGH